MKVLFNYKELTLSIKRLCFDLIENHLSFDDTVIVGLQPRGKFFAKKIHEILSKEFLIKNLNIGYLDITFYRDDFRKKKHTVSANQTEITFLVENKKVIFIDDVLYTGRSIRAAMDAINSFGRPKKIELLVLVNRRFSRELPIEPNYVGMTVDAIDSEKVKVNFDLNNEKKSNVILMK